MYHKINIMHKDLSLKVYYFVIMYIKLVVLTSAWAVVVKIIS